MTVERLQKDAAARLGITPTALRQWSKLPGFPDTSAGWDIAAIQQWRQQEDRKGSQQSDQTAQIRLATAAQKLRQEKVKAEQLERKNEQEKGNILPRDEWELFAAELITVARDRLQTIPQSLCRLVPPEFHAAMLTEGAQSVRRILEELSRSLSAGPDDSE